MKKRRNIAPLTLDISQAQDILTQELEQQSSIIPQVKEDSKFLSKIDENIYISGKRVKILLMYLIDLKSAICQDLLKKEGITHVINLIAHKLKEVPSSSQQKCKQSLEKKMETFSLRQEIKYLKLSMRDQVDCDVTMFVYAAIDFIEESLRQTNGNAKILVHCYKGNSRSVSVIAGYFMWKKSLSSNEAFDLIREKRGYIDPNIGFIGQLMNLEKQLNLNVKIKKGNRLYSFTMSKERIICKNLPSFTGDILRDSLSQFGPLCLLEIKDECFILIVSVATADKSLTERGTSYLLKLAQLLCKYELAPKICYIFKEPSSMVKIPNIVSLNIDYP